MILVDFGHLLSDCYAACAEGFSQLVKLEKEHNNLDRAIFLKVKVAQIKSNTNDNDNRFRTKS